MITRILNAAGYVYRATISQISATYNGVSGYAAAKINRFTKGRLPGWNTAENAIPHEEFPRLRGDAWRLWRDNPYFRKIVRNLCAKVVGTGMSPRSSAVDANGDPATEFRTRAQQLWRNQSAAMDFAGRPGQGGVTEDGLEIQALTAVMLSGDVLYNIRAINTREQRKRGIPAPITIQLIDSMRLADYATYGDITEGHIVYRGLELDRELNVVGYWINDLVPGYVTPTQGTYEPRFYSVDDIRHVYVKEDIDQLRGTTWFAPAMEHGRDTADLQENLVKAAAVSTCVVGGYSLSSGKTRFGQAGATGDDLTDTNGNPITRMSPGMLINLGKDGKLQMYSPTVGTPGGEAFVASLLRGIAAAMPGTKSSTVTGDYRNSSFSSERSADNDAWPELEVVQKWFSNAFCQPIYEAVVTAAVLDGYFDGIVTAGEFMRNKAQWLACEWQGPVARSINPIDDVQAAAMRIKAGISTPQIEAAKLGLRIEDIINAIVDFKKLCEDADLPEVYVSQVLGFDTTDLIATGESVAATANGGANVTTDKAA